MTIFALRSTRAPVQFLTYEERNAAETVLSSVNFTDYTVVEIPSIYTDTSVELTKEFCKLCYAIEELNPSDAFWAFVDWIVAEIDNAFVQREEVEAWLHKYFAEALPVPEAVEVASKETKYKYMRRCLECKDRWGISDVTQEAYENALENSAISTDFFVEDGVDTCYAVLTTRCRNCM